MVTCYCITNLSLDFFKYEKGSLLLIPDNREYQSNQGSISEVLEIYMKYKYARI
jgi:hypothetical protein